MSIFVQKNLSYGEGVAAWAAAAAIAKAMMPPLVADGMLQLEQQPTASEVFAVVAAAAQDAYRQNGGYFPPPRGMEVGVQPDGMWSLVWASDTHTITLSGRPDSDRVNLFVHLLVSEADPPESPRVAAAVAASPTLRQEGWG